MFLVILQFLVGDLVRKTPSAESGCGSHRATSLRAAAAGLRALLAVIHLVLRALCFARSADIRALPAKCSGELAAARHAGSGKPADLGAVHIQRNAARHHLDIVFGEACSRTVIAGPGACIAGIDAVLESFVSHGFSSPVVVIRMMVASAANTEHAFGTLRERLLDQVLLPGRRRCEIEKGGHRRRQRDAQQLRETAVVRLERRLEL